MARHLRDGWPQAAQAQETIPQREDGSTRTPKKTTTSLALQALPGRLSELVGLLSGVRELWVGNLVDDADIACLSELHTLDHLSVRTMKEPLSAASLAHLAALPLRSLQIIGRCDATALHGLEGLKAERLFIGGLKPATPEDHDGLRAVFGLPVKELRLLGARDGVLPLPEDTARALVARRTVEDLFIEGLKVEANVARILLSTPSLREATLHLTDTVGEVEVTDHDHLREVWITGAGLTRFTARNLPRLRCVAVGNCDHFHLEDLASLKAFALPGFSSSSATLRHLPALRRIDGANTRLTALHIEDLPALRLVDLESYGAQLDEAILETLRGTGADLRLAPPSFERKKRVAPKRKITRKQWTHPKVAVAPETWAVLVAGRLLGSATQSKAKELAKAAQHWALETDTHLTAAACDDLTSSTGLYQDGDEVGPIAIGRVVAMVRASDGPSAPFTRAAVLDAMESAGALPEVFWEEMAGIQGTTELEAAEPGLFLVAAGPLPLARLVAGTVHDATEPVPTGTTRVAGQDADQQPHDRVVWGELLHAVERLEVEEVDPAGLPADTALHLIAQYD